MWYLVRHPTTIWNEQKKYQSWSDIPLSAQGEVECRQLVQGLTALRDVTTILSSDLSRCLAVAKPLATNLGIPLLKLPALRELNFGEWDGLTYDEVSEQYPLQQAKWLADADTVAPPGGETLQQLRTRLEQALTPFEAENIIVVTHGGVLATVRSLWLDEDFWLPATGHCLVIDLEKKESRPFLGDS